jgi:hypothetical protein
LVLTHQPATCPYHLVDEQNQEIAWANDFLDAQHLRQLSPRSVRAYAYDLLHFATIKQTKSMPNVTTDRSLLEAALTGLEARRAELEEHISAVRRMIADVGPASSQGRAGRGESALHTGRRRGSESQPSGAGAGQDGRAASTQTKARSKRGGAWTPERRRRMAESMKRRWADGSIRRALKRAKR